MRCMLHKDLHIDIFAHKYIMTVPIYVHLFHASNAADKNNGSVHLK